MTRFFKAAVAALALSLPMASALASPLAMTYSIDSVSATENHYKFDLVLDNHDGSWTSGQNFNWIVFGDAMESDSPLTNFVLDEAHSSTPGMSYTETGGVHNGPTFFDYVTFVGWVPSGLGDGLHWEGTSDAYVGDGQMLFSNLKPNSTHSADFETATLVAVPEPETYGMLLAGLGVLGLLARRRKA